MEKKIVIIEETNASQNVQELLADNSDYNILPINNIIDFYSIDGLKPDVIILDDELAGGSTALLCSILKAQEDTGQIPVILLTDSTATEQLTDYCKPDDMLKKPFDTSRLIAKIESFTAC